MTSRGSGTTRRHDAGLLSGLAVALVLFAGSDLHAQEANVESTGEVIAGTTGNALTLMVVNTSDQVAAGVRVRVSALHPSLLNGRIEPGRIDFISPGESAEFVFYFDVDAEAAGTSANAWFAFTAESGQLNAHEAELRLEIAAETVPADDLPVADDVDGVEVPGTREGDPENVVLYLTGLELPADDGNLYAAGAGVGRRFEDSRGCPGGTPPDEEFIYPCVRTENEVGFSSFPERIELGEAFSFAVAARAQHEGTGRCGLGSFRATAPLRVQLETTSQGFSAYRDSNTSEVESPACPGQADYAVGTELPTQVTCDPQPAAQDASTTLLRFVYRCAAAGADPVAIDLNWVHGSEFRIRAGTSSTSNIGLDVALIYAADAAEAIAPAGFVSTFEIENRVELLAAAAAGVPELRGMTVAEARRALEAVGLLSRVRVGVPAASAAMEGRVERQGIAPGTDVEPGSPVDIFVHTAFVESEVLGDLAGRPAAAARDELVAAGMEVRFQPGKPAPTPDLAGAVESQSPAPGLAVERGSEVVLTVHTAYVATLTVPAVTGMPLEAARRVLANSGLTVEVPPGTSESATVTDQVPAPRMSVRPGTVVALGVANAPAPSAPSRSDDPGAEGARERPVPRPTTASPGATPRPGAPLTRIDCRVDHRVPGARVESGTNPTPPIDDYYGRRSAPCYYEIGDEDFLIQIAWYEEPASGEYESVEPGEVAPARYCTPGLERLNLPPIPGQTLNDLSTARVGGGGSGRAAHASTGDASYGGRPKMVDLMGPDTFAAIAEVLLEQVRPYAVSCR